MIEIVTMETLRNHLVLMLFTALLFDDVAGSTCSWDVFQCDQEEFLCNEEERILLNSKRPLNREHCLAIKDNNEEKFSNYAVEVEMLSLESNEGKNSGYLGIVFNYVDLMNYDFVYLEIHDSLIPPPPKLGNNTPAFTTGYRLNGEYFIDERVNIDQTVIGTKFHSLRLVVDNDSNLSTKIFLDKTFIGAFQEHFAPRLKGGVFIVNKFGSVGLFRNFKLNECENEFDGNGNCVCNDRALTDVSQATNILANGWKTNSSILNAHYVKECDGGDTWYGFEGSGPIGAISTTFKGKGTAELSFGNCLGGGSVKVFLNENVISEASPNTRNDVTFDYSVGDELTILEYGGTIWKLYSLNLNCN